MAEVTLADFIAWEPELRFLAGPASSKESPPIAWVVTARAGVPMLPPLRGSELVLLHERVVEILTEPLDDVLAAIAAAGVAAVILTAEPTLERPARLPLLLAAPAAPANELESMFNRSLTELRGELYRSGAELGRAVLPLAAGGAGPDALLEAAASLLPMTFELRGGHDSDAAPEPNSRMVRLRQDLGLVAVMSERRFRALAELALETLAGPVLDAVRRDEDARPRGSNRAEALHRLLSAVPGEASDSSESIARQLGLQAGAAYRAVSSTDLTVRDLESALGRFGSLHDAGSDGSTRLALLESSGGSAAAKWQGAATALERIAAEAGTGTIAISRPHRLDNLAQAGEEIRFIAALQQSGDLADPVIAMDDVAAVGPFGLLFTLAGSTELADFVDAALGDLPHHDRRGGLRRTLRVFLQCGGAHGEAAERLGIHRNTLAYRLRRIAETSGVDVTDPAHWLTLHLALVAAAIPAARVAKESSSA